MRSGGIVYAAEVKKNQCLQKSTYNPPHPKSWDISEKAANCCYALSDKYWVTDPAGVAWETFHTLGSIPVYGEDPAHLAVTTVAQVTACCVPAQGATEKSRCCE